ncbi:hypothetical protein WA026_006204 [Henosepilachna vigintioctopunctata]|uniref:Uncharacterized protein n=1 Tax=Henosepilachna vigintioctopunctata TaxID=420089 RepID=A0AAW1TP55_9CUCU
MNHKKDKFVLLRHPNVLFEDQVQCSCHSSDTIRSDNTSTEENQEKIISSSTFNRYDFGNVDISRITSLSFFNCKLSSITDALTDLPLKYLNLSKNELSEIPKCLLLGLDILENLDISHNKIANFIFEPNCCKNLKVLILSNNLFEDIPQWIFNLRAKNLQKLQYDFNRITHLRCIFDKSFSFPVQKLSMRNCVVRQEDIKFLKDCINLEDLDVSNSTDTSKFANVIHNIDKLFIKPSWNNIKILKIENLSISLFPEGITWLETLSELYMRHNKFMWLPTNGLEFLVNLEILDLSFNHIVSIPDKLTWLEYLKILKLSHNKIEQLPDISNMESLEVLDLFDNKLTYFEGFSPNLNFVDLECNYFNTEECDLSNYKQMRDNYRKTLLSTQRFNAYKEIGDSLSESEESTSDRSVLENEGIDEEYNFNGSESLEDWDEELRLSNRHEDATASDDEWNGVVIASAPRLAYRYLPIDTDIIYNENVLFCDAD